MSASEMRDALVEHLLEYKKFKNAAAALQGRFEAESRVHTRPFGPDRFFLALVPDYLGDVKIDRLGELCASCIARRDVFLLESEHIAKRAIPVEVQIDRIHDALRHQRVVKFSDFIEKDTDSHVIVVTFLAILELFKQAKISLRQDSLFGDIAISYIDNERPAQSQDEE